ncbi:endonuclease/exonuclease/phosphatase family protein [Chitinophaga sp. Mgbs1]|uniref:Endonuclease/exonuclease/phosphatase family protein n=1 Tax=Chitinophaga solisilvae TaxID=1233460 RepID=A0A433WFT2_9BACT|nr:endonuclease/exonuclease/phosphatase family protein [Chitinophaga solisilvae]
MTKWICVFLITALLLSAYLPFLNPGSYWPAGFAALIFPLVFIGVALTLPCWLFLKRQYIWWILGALVLCTGPALQTWGIRFLNENNPVSPAAGQFSIMTYNTSSMGVTNFKVNPAMRAGVYDMVRATSPDILCMQEFYTNDKPDLSRNIDSLRKIGRYPYHYFTCDWTAWNTWYYGIVLFSRYPVVAAANIPCNSNAVGSGRSILQADVLLNGDTIRIFSAQLISYMLHRDDFEQLKSLRSVNLIRKMKRTFAERAEQAKLLAALVAASPYPAVVCADLNDTPASYTYRTVSSGLQDAFLQSGSGWGRTLSYLSPTLRIDYILPQHRFSVHSCKVFRMPLSEHYPVMARLSLKKH